MRTRLWMVSLLLVGLCVGWGPAPAQAAIWPFSLFATPKPPVKHTKAKRGKARPGALAAPAYRR